MYEKNLKIKKKIPPKIQNKNIEAKYPKFLSYFSSHKIRQSERSVQVLWRFYS